MAERKISPAEQYLLLRGQIGELSVQIDALMNRKIELSAIEKNMLAQLTAAQGDTNDQDMEEEQPDEQPNPVRQELPSQEPEISHPQATPKREIPQPMRGDKKKLDKKWY